jgi:GDP-L-fucose synthase
MSNQLQLTDTDLGKSAKIYVAGHSGMVGAAIVRTLEQKGYRNLLLRTHKELDLLELVPESKMNSEHLKHFFHP